MKPGHQRGVGCGGQKSCEAKELLSPKAMGAVDENDVRQSMGCMEGVALTLGLYGYAGRESDLGTTALCAVASPAHWHGCIHIPNKICSCRWLIKSPIMLS